MTSVFISGSFDDLRSPQMRFIHEVSQRGDLSLGLWTDDLTLRKTGRPPKFPFAERRYLLEAVRYVSRVIPVDESHAGEAIPGIASVKTDLVAVRDEEVDDGILEACRQAGVPLSTITAAALTGFPMLPQPAQNSDPGRKKALVTGCFDWFHSGHVRFFEEASGLGDLYVVVGHDANLRLLKGEGHPLFPEAERRYMVQSVKYVKQALVSSGHGWMDAEPEIERIKPDMYVVNEDGDKPEKRTFCEKRGIAYVVLKRMPREGLPRRQSTDLRGF